MAFQRDSFIDLAVRGNNPAARVFPEPITFKSGRTSHLYVNWRSVSSTVSGMKALVDHVLDFAANNNLQPDCFYGVPEGATKLGILTQFHYGLERGEDKNILPMGRGRPKDHGHLEDRYFLGAPRGEVVVLEDVTTTGGSLLETIDTLLELDNVTVMAAIGLTDRMQTTPVKDVDSDDRYDAFKEIYERISKKEYGNGGLRVEQALNHMDIHYFAMSTARELLTKLTVEPEIQTAIETEFETYRV